MLYTEWRAKILASFGEDLQGKGFIPEAIDAFVETQGKLIDVAYNYGIKEAGNDNGES